MSFPPLFFIPQPTAISSQVPSLRKTVNLIFYVQWDFPFLILLFLVLHALAHICSHVFILETLNSTIHVDPLVILLYPAEITLLPLCNLYTLVFVKVLFIYPWPSPPSMCFSLFCKFSLLNMFNLPLAC